MSVAQSNPHACAAAGMDAPPQLISVVLPVYNESENIAPCLRRLWAALAALPHEILVCYDFDGDSTLPAIARMSDCPPTVRLVRNCLGRGVAHALQAGFHAARGDVVVSTMADLSDPPELIPAMAARIRERGADLVSGSRYMRGGSQSGGPLLKRTLSRWAGLSLYWIAGLKTHDATNNFRAYSARFLRSVTVQSTHGFEVALELTTKAHLMGCKVDEIPSTWTDRSAGQSRFRLVKWLPSYLRWFLRAMAAPLMAWGAWLGALVAAVALSPPWPPPVHWSLRLSIAAAVAAFFVRFAGRIRGRLLWIDAALPLAVIGIVQAPPLDGLASLSDAVIPLLLSLFVAGILAMRRDLRGPLPIAAMALAAAAMLLVAIADRGRMPAVVLALCIGYLACLRRGGYLARWPAAVLLLLAVLAAGAGLIS